MGAREKQSNIITFVFKEQTEPFIAKFIKMSTKMNKSRKINFEFLNTENSWNKI